MGDSVGKKSKEGESRGKDVKRESKGGMEQGRKRQSAGWLVNEKRREGRRKERSEEKK